MEILKKYKSDYHYKSFNLKLKEKKKKKTKKPRSHTRGTLFKIPALIDKFTKC